MIINSVQLATFIVNKLFQNRGLVIEIANTPANMQMLHEEITAYIEEYTWKGDKE